VVQGLTLSYKGVCYLSLTVLFVADLTLVACTAERGNVQDFPCV
jgi:hypothetical protein